MPSCLKRAWPASHIESESPRSKKLCKFGGEFVSKNVQLLGDLISESKDLNSALTINCHNYKKRKIDKSFFSYENCSHCCLYADSGVGTTDAVRHIENKAIKKQCYLEVNTQNTEQESSSLIADRCIAHILQNKRRRLSPQSTVILDKPQEMEEVDATFNSFNYWKPNLPNIDEDLLNILGENSSTPEWMDSATSKDEDMEFSSFNFWRPPVPILDNDMDLEFL